MSETELTSEQRQILTARCLHPVVVCCGTYTFSELAIELLGPGNVRCPVCAIDVTSLVLQHVAACRSFGGDDDAPTVAESWH
jgi:hypothetical protein